MKNRPLFFQIWLVIAGLTAVVLLFVAATMPGVIRKFFTEEAFESIELAQNMVLNQFEGEYFRDYIGPDIFGNTDNDNIRKVRHLVVRGDKLITSLLPEAEIAGRMIDDARKQEEKAKKYSTDAGNKQIFYIITKGEILGREGFVISYMSESYTDNLTKLLFPKVLGMFVVSLLLSWIPALVLSKYISKPLEVLEKKVDIMATDYRNMEISLDRNDEIGRLARSVDNLRLKLIKQDEAEKNFLQSTSHELKTPVMVIQSYAEGITDGVYPKGDLESSVEVILQEANVLENKVSNLLQFNKLEYMKGHEESTEQIQIDEIIRNSTERFKLLNPDIDVQLKIMPVGIEANYENWKSLIENILDNQFRYAKFLIDIRCFQSDEETVLEFFNDGEHIPETELETLFEKFKKGIGGNFGLGLSIVKTVAEKSDFKVSAENVDGGVVFTLRREERG